jgi:serine/threonine protein phosphatase 1
MITKALAGEPDPAVPRRIYAIGDVHGHCRRLAQMHEAIRQDLERRRASALVIHLGDYIDRGPDSAGCVALLLEGSPVPGVPTVNLMGNHERMLLDALEDPGQVPLWLHNGGVTALQSWGIPLDTPPEHWRERIPASHLQFLHSLALSHTEDGYAFVHAGVRPGTPLDQQSEHDLLWIREGFLDWNGTMLPDAPERLIVHGHTPASEPEVRRNRIGVDTNAARGGKLTCAALGRDSVYFLQV